MAQYLFQAPVPQPPTVDTPVQPFQQLKPRQTAEPPQQQSRQPPQPQQQLQQQPPRHPPQPLQQQSQLPSLPLQQQQLQQLQQQLPTPVALKPDLENTKTSWVCPKCSNINYSYRQACNRCYTAKPTAAAAPAGPKLPVAPPVPVAPAAPKLPAAPHVPVAQAAAVASVASVEKLPLPALASKNTTQVYISSSKTVKSFNGES